MAAMNRSILLICLVFAPLPGWAKLEGVYLGARAGHVGLIEDAKILYSDAIGYGADFGIRPHPFLDLLCQFTQSIHQGGLRMTTAFISADVKMLQSKTTDFYLTLGPGFYLSNRQSPGTSTRFGIHGGFGTDLWVERKIRLGIEVRWHGVFSREIADNFWTVMFRTGYFFKM